MIVSTTTSDNIHTWVFSNKWDNTIYDDGDEHDDDSDDGDHIMIKN